MVLQPLRSQFSASVYNVFVVELSERPHQRQRTQVFPLCPLRPVHASKQYSELFLYVVKLCGKSIIKVLYGNNIVKVIVPSILSF